MVQCLEDKFFLGIIKYGFETQQNEKDFVLLEKQKNTQKISILKNRCP